MNDQLTVGLVQISNGFHNGFQNYLPYSVGLLQAYIQQQAPERFRFLLPIYAKQSIAKSLALLEEADIVGFSTYVWNFERSLALAQTLKLEKPETLIVFGGPHVPEKSESFLRNYPFIDICCHGEGERVFLSILEQSEHRNWSQIPGTSYLDSDGQYHFYPKAPRLKDLEQFPSPYLNQTFKDLMETYPEEAWVAIWETNRGCPFSCTFCDWGSAVNSKVYTFDLERLYAELEWFAEHKIDFVYCCDANFGILKRDLEIARYACDLKKRKGFPRRFSIQNTKNMTERAFEIQKMLFHAGLNQSPTLSLQSTDPQTLVSVKRQNISLSSFQELQHRFNQEGIIPYTDILIGLPGETYDSFVNGVSTMIQNGQHHAVVFYNASLLPNAEMADPIYRQTHGIESVRIDSHNPNEAVVSPLDGIEEHLEFVIATNTMPREDWVRCRVFAWMTDFLHYGKKVLQFPLVVLTQLTPLSYRDLIEAFCTAQNNYPVLQEIQRFFIHKAQQIQQGQPEYCNRQEVNFALPLDIWWTSDAVMTWKLALENCIEQFYQESLSLLEKLTQPFSLPPNLLQECLNCSQISLKLHFQQEVSDLHFSYNLWEFYHGVLKGLSIPLQRQSSHYAKNWEGTPYVLQKVS